jgi:hypothetical protein
VCTVGHYDVYVCVQLDILCLRVYTFGYCDLYVSLALYYFVICLYIWILCVYVSVQLNIIAFICL